MTKRLDGILGPVVSTFDATTGELALDAFVGNISAHLSAGLSGVVIAGSTGEAPLLSEDERERIVEAARGVVPDDRWLIAGVGAEATWQAIHRARAAAERGADALLVLPPSYFIEAMTPEAIETHYRRLADSSPVPLMLYNIPRFTRITLEGDLVSSLAKHENIIGIKDSAGNLERLGQYLQAQSDTFSVLTGNGGTAAAALEMGARGGILAVSLFAAELCVELYEAARAGHHGTAAELQQRLTPLARDAAGALGPAGIKAALDLVGLNGGPVRPPLLPITSAQREQIATLLQHAKVALTV
jgi:4-hydroxy-2-oxoglutarate aldolase